MVTTSRIAPGVKWRLHCMNHMVNVFQNYSTYIFKQMQVYLWKASHFPQEVVKHEWEVTHVLSVALRQKQIPSRLLKFLCLKPGSNRSQMYWRRTKKYKNVRGRREWREGLKRVTTFISSWSDNREHRRSWSVIPLISRRGSQIKTFRYIEYKKNACHESTVTFTSK